MEPRLFPHLSPTGDGFRPNRLRFAKRRPLDYNTRFAQDPDYVFYGLESWFRHNLSGAAHVMVGNIKIGNAENAQKRAHAILGKVPGTASFLGLKRSQTVEMTKLLRKPHFFLTLTSHERQPWIVAACAVAKIRETEPFMLLKELVREVAVAV